jgi:tripartite ATP-independent transporter DctP family solute receptor
VEVYANEQLGKEMELLLGIRAGIVDMTVTAATLQNRSEIAAFCELPFLLQDTLHMQAVVDGPIGRHIEETLLKETGLRPIAYFQRGPRHLTSNRPIRHPDDLKGMILRVPSVPAYVTAWSALGAKPTPMAFSEVFTALQQGTIEAQENPFAMIRSASFAEVQDYLNLTGHVISWAYVVVGEKQFQRLPEDLKVLFLQAAREMQAYEHHLFLKNETQIQQELKDKGMQFIEVDKPAFIEKSKSAIYNSLSPPMQDIYRQIEALKK